MKKSLNILQEIYNDKDVKTEVRVKAAAACLPFEFHRKPQQLDINADVNIHGIFGHMIRAIGVSDLEGQIIDETAKQELEALEDLSQEDED